MAIQPAPAVNAVLSIAGAILGAVLVGWGTLWGRKR